MSPDISGFFHAGTNSVSYILSDPRTRRAAVIDPVLDYNPRSARVSTESADQIIAFVSEKNLSVEWLLETHPHADHRQPRI